MRRLCAAFLLLVGCGGESADERARRERQGDGEAAAEACQGFVRARLKAPSTAKFEPAFRATVARRESPERYRVTSYVDAQNGFGAIQRSAYVCDVNYDPLMQRYRLASVVLLDP